MLAGSFSLGGTEDVEPPITLHPAAVRCCGRPRPQLRRGGPEGIGRLQGMARDLDLELLGDVRLVERTAAVGAAVRQGRLVNLIDLVRGGRLAVGLDPVVSAGLATGLLWLAGGLTLGEGVRLALAGTGRLVELAAEALVLGLQVTQASLKGLAAGTRDGLHTSMIGEVLATTVIPRPRSRRAGQFPEGGHPGTIALTSPTPSGSGSRTSSPTAPTRAAAATPGRTIAPWSTASSGTCTRVPLGPIRQDATAPGRPSTIVSTAGARTAPGPRSSTPCCSNSTRPKSSSATSGASMAPLTGSIPRPPARKKIPSSRRSWAGLRGRNWKNRRTMRWGGRGVASAPRSTSSATATGSSWPCGSRPARPMKPKGSSRS